MTIKPKIILFTNRDDFTCDYLINKLHLTYDLSCYFRINSEDIVNTTFDYDSKGKIIISFNSTECDLSDVKSIYFRRVPTIFPAPTDNNDANFINRERREFLEGILLSLNAKWINPLFATIKGERKLYQLKLANNIGLKTPNTLVTNNPISLREFIKEKNCIIKPISHGLQVTNNKVFSIYTSSIKESDILNESEIYEVPSFIQEQVANQADIRVTIIDNNIFAVKIKKINDDEIDWRKPTIDKTYLQTELPPDLCEKLLLLNSLLDLKYSAIDLIQNYENEYIFLEVNPAGEWVWLERELNLKISDNILKSLLE